MGNGAENGAPTSPHVVGAPVLAFFLHGIFGDHPRFEVVFEVDASQVEANLRRNNCLKANKIGRSELDSRSPRL